jgi:hypothetical protein
MLPLWPIMELDEFWALTRRRKTDDDFAVLTDELAARDAETIVAFEDRLTELLYALDTPAHAKAARARNDWFLYVRCAAVAAGREAYEEVLERPAKLRRFAHREAEHLLSVAPAAYERSTGALWEHETLLSYESGSNTAAWGEPEPDPDRPDFPAEPGPAPWLSLFAVAFGPGGHDSSIEHLAHALNEDPAWRAWWAATGIPECHLTLIDPEGHEGTTVKVGRTRVEAQAVASARPAAEDVTALFEAVRARLELAPPPPLPEPTDEPPPSAGPPGLLQAIMFILRARGANRRADT